MNHPVILFLAFCDLQSEGSLTFWLIALKVQIHNQGEDDTALENSLCLVHSLGENTFSQSFFQIKHFTQSSTSKMFKISMCSNARYICIFFIWVKLVLHCSTMEWKCEDHSPPNKMAVLEPCRYPYFQLSLKVYALCSWSTVFLLSKLTLAII